LDLTEQERKFRDEAVAFAKAHRKAIAARLTDTATYLPEESPVSVFMAGSPGAGKTEASIELVARVGGRILRIDPDDLRGELPGYCGDNSWLLQRAVSVLVDRILDRAFSQSLSFLLDGTLSHYDQAAHNIERSLRKGRAVQVLYVYQEPALAWKFVQAREALEGRHIPLDSFIDQYFAARDVVNRLKAQFGREIRVDLLQKNTDNSTRLYENNIVEIDRHVPEKYDATSLHQMLGPR